MSDFRVQHHSLEGLESLRVLRGLKKNLELAIAIEFGKKTRPSGALGKAGVEVKGR